MNFIFKRRPRLYEATVMAAVLFLAVEELHARGGGARWGYRPPAGNPLTSMWLFASPWGALNGWSIPHHSSDGNRQGTGYGGMGYTGYTGFDSGSLPTIDRSVAFPGSSSNLAPLIPSFNTPVPTKPYQTNKKFEPPYYNNYNNYWLHGYWGGGQWGWARWGGAAGIWSVARWSYGPIYYSSGYGVFRNPFLAAGQPAPVKQVLDYSSPIEDVPDDDEPVANSTAPGSTDKSASPPAEESLQEIENYIVKSPEVKAGLKSFDAACEAFKKKDFDLALKQTDEALDQLPIDSAVHEFRALVLFARGDYQESAATIYAVLAVSPGWDWTTLIGLYADQDEYTRQLRALEAAHKKTPDSAAITFLRGYHYTTCRHFEAGVKQFQALVKLLPDDDLAAALVALISGAVEISPQASPARRRQPRRLGLRRRNLAAKGQRPSRRQKFSASGRPFAAERWASN